MGNIISLSAAGALVDHSHYPTLIVEQTDTSGNVTAFDWLDYGSFLTLPTSTTTLSDMSGGAFTISPVAWTRGAYATKIKQVTADTLTGFEDIVLTDPAPFTANQKIQYFYYGHDDGAKINLALSFPTTNSTDLNNAAIVRLPGGCGTTIPIVLPQDASPNFVNPTLAGTNLQSTGLYAFAQPLGMRGEGSSPGGPVLNRMIYGGFANTSGGGLRDMLIEGLGIPQGYGYYGLAESGTIDPTGYQGPPNGDLNFFIPSGGDLIEIDGGKYMRFENLHATDGGGGMGNSVFHCGVDEADPSGFLNSAHVGNIIVADSRFDGNSSISGATNPDFSMRIGNSCHDSVYKAISAYDGTTADVLEFNGNIFSQIHVNSDAANSPVPLHHVSWPANTVLAGVANFGIYTTGNTSIAQTQCDIANLACVRFAVNSASPAVNPGQVTDTQMKCGTLVNVPSTYYGVELADGAINTSVTGTAAAGACKIPPSQLIHLDGSLDATVSLCGNSNATVAACTGGYGFAPGRYYTQPGLSYASLTVASGKLYAVPFASPVGGAATTLGVDVTSPLPSTQCELGLYSSANGAPADLVVDSGHVSVASGGMQTKPISQTLAANTLYFLVVGCSGAVGLEATNSTSPLSGPAVGLPDFVTSANTAITAMTWSFGPLPSHFGTALYASSAPVPNVYLGD